MYVHIIYYHTLREVDRNKNIVIVIVVVIVIDWRHLRTISASQRIFSMATATTDSDSSVEMRLCDALHNGFCASAQHDNVRRIW